MFSAVTFSPDSYASDVIVNGVLTRTTPYFENTAVAVSPVDNYEDGGCFTLGKIDQSIASSDSDFDGGFRTVEVVVFNDDFAGIVVKTTHESCVEAAQVSDAADAAACSAVVLGAAASAADCAAVTTTADGTVAACIHAADGGASTVACTASSCGPVLTLDETGHSASTDSYTVELSAQPTADVVLTVGVPDALIRGCPPLLAEGPAGGRTITFTP